MRAVRGRQISVADRGALVSIRFSSIGKAGALAVRLFPTTSYAPASVTVFRRYFHCRALMLAVGRFSGC
jgi:hypothetical protein